MIQNGNNLIDFAEPGPEKEALQVRFNDTIKFWKSIKERSYKRKEDIETLHPLIHKHEQCLKELESFICESEKRKESFKSVSFEKSILLQQIKDLEARFFTF